LSNASNSTGLAQQHAQNAIAILNQTWTKEIAERNHRIASELTTALTGLKDATTVTAATKPAANDIKDKVTNPTNFLGEALSVRLTKDQINNSTIQALALANIINMTDRRYADAFGAGYGDMSSSSSAMTMRAGEGEGDMLNAASLYPITICQIIWI
jgi:hypothetical protein